jgi:hypothetical protein
MGYLAEKEETDKQPDAKVVLNCPTRLTLGPDRKQLTECKLVTLHP